MNEICLNDLGAVSYDLAVTIENNPECRSLIEWLANCVAKRYRRGQLVLLDHLAWCSTMKRVIGLAVKVVRQWSKVTTADRRECALYLASVIISEAQIKAREEVVAK